MAYLKNCILSAIVLFLMTSCQQPSTKKTGNQTMNQAEIPDSNNFKQTLEGKQVHLYTIGNGKIKAAITNFGGRLVSLLVPDSSGKLTDVVLGYNSLKDYQQYTKNGAYFGALIGRYGNRIAKGKFTLDGKSYQLAINNPPNALHGGPKGFSTVVWDVVKTTPTSVELHYLSKDGEESYPGNLDVHVTYALTDDNGLSITYKAKTDKTTILNLTNHSYFNLNGEGSGTVNNHSLQLNASKFTPVDATLIPTGKLEPVAGTPFDFTKPEKIGARIDVKDQQLEFGKGYDHNFVLDAKDKSQHLAAVVVGDKSGIKMEAYTDQPGIQFYGGNFLEGGDKDKTGKAYEHRTALCLETQHFPDSPNHPQFPTTVLKPGETFSSVTSYRFPVKK